MDAVDNMFEGTLNPGAHRQNWFDYLQSNAAGDVATDLGITDETDLSLMLPPIENIDLPLLNQLRETLSELNADACCYPYSARNATEIKTIVSLYNAVKAKAVSQKSKVRLDEIRLNKEELLKTGIKVRLMTRATMPTSERKKSLAQLTTQISRIRAMRRALSKQKKDMALLQKRQLMFRDRLERIFFSRPNWKFKDTRSDRTRAGGRAIGSVDRIDPNDIEIISSGQTISHQTIVEAIQERVSGLQQSSIDIHPIPWKNLLIVPYAVKGLSPGWDQAEGKDYRLGQARNKFKTNNFRRASALIATWEQFATFDTKFSNTFQKEIKAHNVKLNAQVEISFDVNGTIRPNVPWWDNEYAAENGKRQVGGRATEEEEAVRDNYDGLGAGVGVYHTKTNSSGVQFYSQVGFAWQYKVPTHSRSNLRNTDWILATDENGDPFKEFNLPKGTTEYAVRLCFIKADGNVVPISNVLTGSDVQQKMEALINRKIRGKRFVPHSERYNVAGKNVSGTREDASVWTQVSETDRKRLTRKARALLNITSEVNMETFQQKILPLKQILNSYDLLVTETEARIVNVNALNAVVNGRISAANIQLAAGRRMDGNEFQDPTTGAVIPAPIVGSSNFDVAIDVPLVAVFKTVTEATTVAQLDALFKASVSVIGPDAYNADNPIDVIQQARALRLAFNDPATNASIAARDSAIDKYNSAASAVEDIEQKMVAWSAGGHYDNFSTEHAPGLISKDREVTQVISFTKTTFPSKRAKEERENAAAAAAGTAPPHRRPGYWNPWTEDLPDEACLMLEPHLRTFRDEESLGLLNAGQLRVHNYSGSPGTVDVSGETPSIGFTAWKNEQARIATKFNDAKNPRDLTPDELRINDFNSRNLASKINFSMKSSRAAALIQAQKTREREEREKFEKQEEALRAQLEVAQRARDAVRRNRNAEIDLIRQNDASAQATALLLAQIARDMKQAQVDLSTYEVQIKTTQANITALEAQQLSGLSQQQQTDLASLKLNLSTLQQEAQLKEDEIVKLEERLRDASAKYDKDVAAGIQKKEAELDKKIEEAEKDLADLNKQFQLTLRAAETAAQAAAAQLEKRVAILARSTNGDSLKLEKDIISGNIALDAKNAGNPDIDQHVAPADMRFGGGYYWKEAEDIKSSPFGQYLAYDSAATSGDRLELMWSELNPDDSSQAKDDVVLYRYTDANTPSVKALVKRNDVQPVLTDNIYVKGKTANKLEPSENLFRLTKANTKSDRDKSIVYIGRRQVGRQELDGVSEQVSVLEFYETLPKPGTFVHFVLNKKSADETRIGGKFGDIGRIRNRLRVLDSAFSVAQDTNSDDVIDFENPQALVGLTGRIESVHIGNLKTTYSAAKEKVKVDALAQLEIDRTNEVNGNNDPLRIKALTDSIIKETNELKRLRNENGHFNFGAFKAEGSYRSVVLVDIRISSDNVTGLVKNVLFADVAVVNPYSNELESTVLCKEDSVRYQEYKASVYQAKHDDTIQIIGGFGNNILKVNKEKLLPRFADGTDVMYFFKNKYLKGSVTGFVNGMYVITDIDGTVRNTNPDDVQALVEDTDDALNVISDVNNDTNTIGLGLRKSQYVALYHKLSVGDVDRGAGPEKYCEELEEYVGKTGSAALERGFSQLNEDNYRKYDAGSNPVTFSSAPDVLFRAEFKPVNPLAMHKVTGDVNNQGFLENCLGKLQQPNATARNLADDNNTYEVDRIMAEVVLVYENGTPKAVVDGDGDVIDGQFVTVRYQDEKTGDVKYANLDIADIDSIKVPHTAARIDPTATGIGYTKVSDSSVQNMVPNKAINITAPAGSSLMMAKSMPATFALTSGTEGDTDLLEEDDEKGGWTSSWAQETVAAWAASSSSSDEQMLKALSDVEQMVPNWASSSSGDESVEKAAWATSTSASGGFASSTSDDDADDLATIISKIDRVSKPVSAAWAEDSESDD